MLFFEILNQSCASVSLSNRLTCPELEQALGLRQSWVETAETRGLVAASKGPGTLRQYHLTAMNDDMESTFKKSLFPHISMIIIPIIVMKHFFCIDYFFFGIDTKMSLKKNMSRLLSTANNQPRGAERRFSPPEPLEPGIPQLPPSPVSPDLKERHGKGWGSVFRSFGKHQLVIALSFCKHQLIIALEYLL